MYLMAFFACANLLERHFGILEQPRDLKPQRLLLSAMCICKKFLHLTVLGSLQ